MASPFEQGRALWWPYPLEREPLDRCAAGDAGTHDFTAFTPTDTEHVRFERDVMRCEWAEGSGIGPTRSSSSGSRPTRSCATWSGRWSGRCSRWPPGGATLEDFTALLEGAPRERGGETAPAHGLYLASVRY